MPSDNWHVMKLGIFGKSCRNMVTLFSSLFDAFRNHHVELETKYELLFKTAVFRALISSVVM